MKHLNRLLSSAAAILCVALALVISSTAPAQPAAKPPELKILEKYLGTWKFEMVSKVAEWNPKESKYSGTTTNEWVLDGWFQHHKVKYSNDANGIDIITFDPRKKVFRIWSYDSHGFSSEMAGDWDEKTKTLTTKGDLGDGITAASTMRFLDNDNRETTYVAKDAAGKIFMDIRGKLTRQKK